MFVFKVFLVVSCKSRKITNRNQIFLNGVYVHEAVIYRKYFQ